MQRVVLTADLIEAFAGTFLSPMYDNPRPTPELHRECWRLYCTEAELAAIAAPREHAKSTALTHDYALATINFRAEDYVIIVSATEELAIGHLGDIAKELRENEDMIAEFKITRLVSDSKTDIVVEYEDGHQARIVAKGSGQKMRGMKWRGKRPGLIICDDLEEDEQVENLDRRKKFRKWFYRALLPCRRRGGKVRMHGTILHEDALLARVMRKGQTTWATRLFKAHAAFDDFSDILWPEQFPEARLRAIRQAYIDDGDSAGYSQEYLNDPHDNSEAYLRKSDFIPMEEGDHEVSKRVVVGCDFAVSKADRANRTSFTVAGEDARQYVHFFDQFVGRWDTQEWMDLLFDIQKRHSPEVFFVEDGVIWKSVSPTIYKEMHARAHRGEMNVWINFQPIPSTKDKATRGRPFQKRMRTGACRFAKDTDWYEDFEQELLKFTGNSEATLDDQFDSAALVVKGLDTLGDVEEEDFDDEETQSLKRDDPRLTLGRNRVTGY